LEITIATLNRRLCEAEAIKNAQYNKSSTVMSGHARFGVQRTEVRDRNQPFWADWLIRP
jgi:hypothetical protein